MGKLALREGVDNSYVSRVANLTTFAPNIVVTNLDDTRPDHFTLFELAVNSALLCDEQFKHVFCAQVKDDAYSP